MKMVKISKCIDHGLQIRKVIKIFHSCNKHRGKINACAVPIQNSDLIDRGLHLLAVWFLNKFLNLTKHVLSSVKSGK